MVYTMLSVDDFSSMECTSSMTRMDYLLAVCEVFLLKSMYGEEDGLMNQQYHHHQEEKPIRRKRSMSKTRPRKVTEKFICCEKSIIKKAVENRVILENRGNSIMNGELNIEFKNLIICNGGSLESVKLVIEKTLFKTDVKPEEGRFSIPQKQMSNSFLEPEEDAHLSTRNEGKMCEIKVMLIEPSRRISEINLRKWFMNKDNGKVSLSYVLVTYWNEVVTRNNLECDTKVQLWAFRKGVDLCFALVKLQD
ncbi:hypothetical protein H5410_055325 [Solanum commersonii]|uniref:B3 domain-containing protein n=1 Tax=Solanum commersonii TaxID=4109 RepID=A0A9J5WIS1_SOLCO|nr:hypothetical protein H5410_055325 [Solanum commersonii]